MLTARRQLAAVTTVFTGQAAIGTRWSASVERVYLVNEVFAVAGDVAVSEINYHPLEPTPAESATAPGVTASDFQWIELRNIGTRTVNLFEVGFTDTKPFTGVALGAFTLPPGATALVVKNRAAFIARYGASQASRIAGEWESGTLDDGGETIALIARDGSAIQTFAYNDGGAWPGRADGKGSSLEYRSTDFGDTAMNLAENWRSSSEVHGSPGTAGIGPVESVAINELLTQTALPFLDAVELRNLTASPIDLSGWFLSNVVTPETAESYKMFRLPNGTTLPANGWLVFDQRDFNPNGAWNPAAGPPGPTEFSFDGNHDSEVWLLSPAAGGGLRFVDHAEIGPARLNESFGRLPDGTGNFAPMAQRTAYNEGNTASPRPKLGATNSAIRVGPVVIHEVHHSPFGGATTLEFVELHNPTAAPVALDRWRLHGNADFDFTSESIPAGGLLVVVPFSPTDTTLATAFRSAYGLSGPVPMAGPWGATDSLVQPGETALYRAGSPPPLEPGYFPLTLEDESDYQSGTPWPDTDNGMSLNRLALNGDGDLASSWAALPPSPGGFATASGPTFAAWTIQYFPAGGVGSGSGDDPDRDGVSNFLEYASHGHPLVPGTPPLPASTMVISPGPAPTTCLLTYTRPLDRPDALWSVESSSALVTWQPIPDAPVASTPTTETRQVSVESNSPRLYFRFKVTFDP